MEDSITTYLYQLSPFAARIIILFGVIALGILANLIAKKFIIRALEYLASKTAAHWDDILVREKVFVRLSRLAPAIVVYVFAPAVLPDTPYFLGFIRSIVAAYMVVITTLVVDALINTGAKIYAKSPLSKRRPITAYVQVVKIFLVLISCIFIISILFHRSPWALLSGLGALTAVLMLVFKDSILGFVASIQIAANDTVRVGDWIEMSKYGADGDVIEVTLNTVKVQNWDKTISTIPTYALATDPVKNWRGMSESGGRRIKRAVNIDMHSVRFCSEEMLQRFSKIQLLRPYLEKKKQELDRYNSEHGVDNSEIVNGRRQTNVGVFRAYIEAYLRAHPKIHQELTFLVRQLAPTDKGLPIEIYVFSNDQVWANYEGIQADIFDHILAVVPEFGLSVYQSPSSSDVRLLCSQK